MSPCLQACWYGFLDCMCRDEPFEPESKEESESRITVRAWLASQPITNVPASTDTPSTRSEFAQLPSLKSKDRYASNFNLKHTNQWRPIPDGLSPDLVIRIKDDRQNAVKSSTSHQCQTKQLMASHSTDKLCRASFASDSSDNSSQFYSLPSSGTESSTKVRTSRPASI